MKSRSESVVKRANELLKALGPATALFVHAAIHIIGCHGCQLIVDENIRKAAEMATRSEIEAISSCL